MSDLRKPILLDPIAEEEVTAAYVWYAVRSPQAATRFNQSLNRAMDQILDRPDSFPAYLGGTRVCQLHKFPYLVVFARRADMIYVVAFAHGHRKPGYWRDRIKP